MGLSASGADLWGCHPPCHDACSADSVSLSSVWETQDTPRGSRPDRNCITIPSTGHSNGKHNQKECLYRDEELTQLTQDHSYYAELLRQGNTEFSLENCQKNVLLKALGPEATAEGQFFVETVYPDDILLLCTDGLYNAVSHAELQQLIEQTADLQSTVNEMIALALSHGASDNITAILYRHDGEVMAW